MMKLFGSNMNTLCRRMFVHFDFDFYLFLQKKIPLRFIFFHRLNEIIEGTLPYQDTA